jgi:hypothetical protein
MQRTTTRRRLWRWTGGVLGTAVVAMIVLHLPPVRRVLAAHGHTGGALCPLGYGAAAANPAAERAHNAALRGDSPARERPALGFALDVTTVADLERWARSHDVACQTRHGGTQVECGEVAGPLVPGDLALTSVMFAMNSHGTLASIKTTRRSREVAPVASAFSAVTHQLTSRAGVPMAEDGSAAPDVLASATLRQASVEYRFTNYRAVVRATNLGDGFALTESYATLVD